RHAGRELVGSVAGEHEMRVAVDEPRDHASACRVEARVGVKLAGGADGQYPPIVDDERGLASGAERAVAKGRVVGDEHTDVVDDDRAHPTTSRIAASSSPATSIDT